jgi:hypothetical protein
MHFDVSDIYALAGAIFALAYYPTYRKNRASRGRGKFEAYD